MMIRFDQTGLNSVSCHADTTEKHAESGANFQLVYSKPASTFAFDGASFKTRSGRGLCLATAGWSPTAS